MGLLGIGVIAVLVRSNGTKAKEGQVFYFQYSIDNKCVSRSWGVVGRAELAVVQVGYCAGFS